MLGLKLNILVKGVPDNSKQHSFTHLFDAPPTSLCESDPSLLKAPKSPDMFLLRAWIPTRSLDLNLGLASRPLKVLCEVDKWVKSMRHKR